MKQQKILPEVYASKKRHKKRLFFHPDFNCCCRSFTGSARRSWVAEYTASEEFHLALKIFCTFIVDG